MMKYQVAELQNLTDSDDPCCLFAPAVPSLTAIRILVAIEGMPPKCRVVVCANASSKVVCIIRKSVARKRSASTQKLSLARCHARCLATPTSGELQVMSVCNAPTVVSKCAALTSPSAAGWRKSSPPPNRYTRSCNTAIYWEGLKFGPVPSLITYWCPPLYKVVSEFRCHARQR